MTVSLIHIADQEARHSLSTAFSFPMEWPMTSAESFEVIGGPASEIEIRLENMIGVFDREGFNHVAHPSPWSLSFEAYAFDVLRRFRLRLEEQSHARSIQASLAGAIERGLELDHEVRRYPDSFHWANAKANYLGPARPRVVIELVTDEDQ